ncbi:MAG: polysaccharide biosynthesis protein [Immundisolibacter sp.]|uniref:polysaccharide biosynthesis protein n=1 Tax=Immundisolibacter sp. TaxID=1934948 RepID=UPI003EE37EA6
MRLNKYTALVLCHDALVAVVAWLGAYSIRFNLTLPAIYLTDALSTLAWVIPLQVLIFWRFGLYRGLWRFASLPDLKRLLRAIGLAAALVPGVLVLFRIGALVPRSVLLLDPLLLLIMMGGSRLLYRVWKDHRLSLSSPNVEPVLIVGAGTTADTLLRQLHRGDASWQAVGLLDDDSALRGRQLQGVRVLGKLDELVTWARTLNVQNVILALPSAPHTLRRRLSEVCFDAGIAVQTVPTLEELMRGRVTAGELRPLELDDLLGRDPVQLDDASLAAWLGPSCVLVTGAGGSIGSELVKQIVRFRPRRLVLLEQSEYALYRLCQEFDALFVGIDLIRVIGDVKDGILMKRVFQRHRPALVFHTAAYKHVPLMEENPLEALRNNVLGTWTAGRAAVAAGVEKFVLVSSDKAVEPTSVMGASKRLSELVGQLLQQPGGTCFVAVRFGNVLGSSGSVVPRFRAQIEAGGPITVTHPEVTRYFMSISEAAQLVLQAGLMGQAGEVFLLDMGEPVKIVDLARLMLRLARQSEAQIPIVFTGLQPGEKLFERLHSPQASVHATSHPKLWRVLEPTFDNKHIAALLLDLKARVQAGDEAATRDWVLNAVNAGVIPPHVDIASVEQRSTLNPESDATGSGT